MKRTLTTATALTAALILSGHADAATITGVTIEDVSSEFAGLDRRAERTIDGAGFTEANGYHNATASALIGGNQVGYMWHTNVSGGTGVITYDLATNYDLSHVKVWNYNSAGEASRGARTVEILIASSVGGSFTSLGDFTFTAAPLNDSIDFGQVIDLSSFSATDNARLVRFNIKNNHGSNGVPGPNDFAGLSEVRFDAVPEPGSLALLTLGGLLIARRRRG